VFEGGCFAGCKVSSSSEWYDAGVPSSFVSMKFGNFRMAEAMKWRNGH